MSQTTPSIRDGADVLTAARGKLQAELRRELAAGRDGWALGALHAARLDGILAGQFRWTVRSGVAVPKGLAIAAVGSLGRGAVALASDADVVSCSTPSSSRRRTPRPSPRRCSIRSGTRRSP